jgi:glycosyltransferase involved in cell wall biosynthesis
VFQQDCWLQIRESFPWRNMGYNFDPMPQQEQAATARPCVGINAHLLAGGTNYRRAGIHQYIWQVLRHLPAAEIALQPVVYTQQTGALADRPELRLVSSRWPTERRLVRIVWEQTVWPWLAWRDGLALAHSMAFVLPLLQPCPTIVTIYDLSFVYYPGAFPAWQRLYLKLQTAHACRRAQQLITISESGRRDVQQQFDVSPERITVVQPGVDPAFKPLPPDEVARFRQQQALPERFVLHVGTLQPRKNLPLLLDAFARLLAPDVELVMAGGKGWLFAEIFAKVEALGLQDRVRFVGYVPDEALPWWYNAAALLVFPSLYEGFGLPVVEAMACGTPVIAANTSSIPEAAGDAALPFEPDDVAGLTERMDLVLNNTAVSDQLRQKGPIQAKQFSWERAGRETAVVYQTLLNQL